MHCFHQNRGMYLEEVLNKTISYYLANNICFFEKRFVPFKILKKVNNTKFLCCLLSKSTVDYFGFLNGNHIEFEAKETSKDFFTMSHIQDHQHTWMLKANQLKIKTYVIIYFSKFNEFFVVPFCKLVNHKRHSKVPYDFFVKNFSSIDIEFPGILDFIKKM